MRDAFFFLLKLELVIHGVAVAAFGASLASASPMTPGPILTSIGGLMIAVYGFSKVIEHIEFDLQSWS